MSSEHSYVLRVLLILLSIKLFLINYLQKNLRISDKKHYREDKCLRIVLYSQYLSFFNSLFLFGYFFMIYYNGSQYLLLEILASLCQKASEFCLTMLLVLLASGYTIIYHDIEEHNDAYLIFFFLFGMILLIFDGLSFLTKNQETIFHKDQSIVGYFMSSFEIIFVIWFFFNLKERLNELRNKNFAKSLLPLGLTWWGGKILVIYCTSRVEIRDVWQWYGYGMMGVELAVVLQIIKMLTLETAYHKVSYKGSAILDVTH